MGWILSIQLDSVRYWRTLAGNRTTLRIPVGGGRRARCGRGTPGDESLIDEEYARLEG
jgi:hypothetical protein